MIELCEWQIIDEDNGLVMPWLSHPFLAWLKSQDWSDKNVIMFGAGLGDNWLSKRCKKLVVVERNNEWYSKCASVASKDITYIYRPCDDSAGRADYYLEIPSDIDFNVIINDDAYRTELCQVAVDYFKGKGGILVCDNFDQDFVWKSPKAIEILEPYKRNAFYQPGHINHEGNAWNTSYWNIPA